MAFSNKEPVHIEAQLGNPQAECKGFGICTIDELSPDAWETYRPYQIRRVKARMEWIEDQLRIEFPVNGMLIPARAHFFTGSHFLVESALILPEHLCRKWNVEKMLAPAGKYPLEFLDETFKMELPVIVSHYADTVWKKAV